MLNMFMVDNIIKTALAEDIGTGDITTLSTVPENRSIRGKFVVKEEGIICGFAVAKRVFEILDPAVRFEILVKDGECCVKGAVPARISGPARSVLTGERVALNFLQHMSGIATRTAEAVRAAKGTRAKITDTRKTTPGLRVLEKYAVEVGGGSNHRFNLADGVLIKDNHIKAAGGITAAVKAARANAPHTLKIEVEVGDLVQAAEAVAAKADIIMLDNMSLGDMALAVRRIDGQALVEASGNMGEKDLHAVAETGVNLISIGALTHSVKALDISLEFEDE